MRIIAETNERLLWSQGTHPPYFDASSVKELFEKIDVQLTALDLGEKVGFGVGGRITVLKSSSRQSGFPIIGIVPAVLPQNLGSFEFRKKYGLKYNYLIGEMANGITSIEMVYTAAKNGFLGMFGTGGLTLSEVADAISKLKQRCGDAPFGLNLLCNIFNPELEFHMVKNYLENNIRIVSASAYTNVTSNLIYYRVKGIKRDMNGNIQIPNKIIAKISRPEIASRFLSPPSLKMLTELKERNLISEDEATLAANIPVANDLIIEGSSGGHTDNGVISCLFTEIKNTVKSLARKYNFAQPVHLGIAGGIGTPEALASAFTLGADFIMTGSINQSCIEAGTSETVREMLVQAKVADVAMVPSADMFESGAKVQILKKGTFYHIRAKKMHDMYLKYNDVDDINLSDKEELESILKCTISEAWERTVEYFSHRDPKQLERASSNAKHKFALILRSYLGKSSKWAISGNLTYKNDYQVWCGPSMGAFNSWVKDTHLDKLENRTVCDVAFNLLWGGAYYLRIQFLRCQNVQMDASLDHFIPKTACELQWVKAL